MSIYKLGSHIIATLKCDKSNHIRVSTHFKLFVEQLVVKYELKSLGAVFHDFQPEGFTGIVCLSESHLSIHTWPEYNKINLDIYLSNYERDNDQTVDDLYHAMIDFFGAEVINYQKIKR